MRTRVLRFPCSGPDDLAPLHQALAEGRLHPERVVAVLGKTEGNGCVNDFTRAFATTVLKRFFAERLELPEDTVAERIALVMSGGTEGGLSPHWLVFEVDDAASPAPEQPGLAAGIAFTDRFAPEQIGRLDQVRVTAEAVRRAMATAGIERAEDVHYVQIKCPLLTAARCEDARRRGATVATSDTYESMGFSRGASALGVALALGEVEQTALSDAAICHDFDLWSGRASTSAGIELMRNEILVLGNAPGWDPALRIGHDVMADALDGEALDRARATLGDGSLVALLAKAEPSRSGHIRGQRHTMWDDSDINATRHARALVGGVLGGRTGDLALFVSGGAEHQGPDGGGPLALIVESGS
ncbi:ring-opening amidohydrolase [Alloalcanivorax gelatiniphagus]|uniref:Cyanuric acid amidohydrolase n=1 Tax=Alloalcanivorax gelatiniphagus TaxID=1194167 RepID=A0ABY2XKZ7_9GAMM|nr:ring-opening amidohydrolase [Alloalcanivorax gelatiniphagus]TMW11922.1 ring-opening amidohydrolase [Alloalcanivorax gelatiniphagus]